MFNKVISKSSAEARASYLERIRTNGRCFDVREDGKNDKDKATGAKDLKPAYREDIAPKPGVSGKEARERHLARVKANDGRAKP